MINKVSAYRRSNCNAICMITHMLIIRKNFISLSYDDFDLKKNSDEKSTTRKE